MKNDNKTGNEIIAQSIKDKVDEHNQLINQANKTNLSVYIILSQKTIERETLYSEIGIKLIETTEY